MPFDKNSHDIVAQAVQDLDRRVRAMAACFTILSDWEVFADLDGEVSDDRPWGSYLREVTINKNQKRAHVKPWGEGQEDPEYVLHEVLHVAFRAFCCAIETKAHDAQGIEEQLVRDLCTILTSKKA